MTSPAPPLAISPSLRLTREPRKAFPMLGSATSYFKFPQNMGAARASAEEAPPRIVDESGLIRVGMFKARVREMNLGEAKLLKGLGGLGASWPVPPLVVEWIGAGLAHPHLYLGLI